VGRYLALFVPDAVVEMRESPFLPDLPHERVTYLARRIAATKVPASDRKLEDDREPLYGEVEFEKRRIRGRSKAFGVIYDGIHLQRVFTGLIATKERLLSIAHIIFTNRLFATWDTGDRRYHLRTSVYGVPSIVSSSGIVEAPARPREFYMLKQQYQSLGRDPTEVKARFAGRFIDYDDERLTDIAKGMALQAVAYCLTGDPFCEDRGCRLFNAHWQEDLIFAQLTNQYELCPRHARLLGRT